MVYPGWQWLSRVSYTVVVVVGCPESPIGECSCEGGRNGMELAGDKRENDWRGHRE